jgi:hypothetical protein
MRPRNAVAFVAVASVIALAAGELPDQRLPMPAVARTCRREAALQPVVLPGSPWGEHRHWLEGRPGFDGERSRYFVMNVRTRRLYPWRWWGHRQGNARFGVSTVWALATPWWTHDRWVLLYDCA